MLFYEYEGLDDVAYQSMVNAVKALQPSEDGAVLPYEDGSYTIRTYDENGNETISQEAVTQGSFTLQEDGKLRWEDSQVAENGYSEGCLFVQMGE